MVAFEWKGAAKTWETGEEGVRLKVCKTENENRVEKVDVKMTPPEKAPKQLTPAYP